MMMKYLSPQRSLATSVSVLSRVNVIDRLLMIARYLGGSLVALLEACGLSIPSSAAACTHIWVDCCCLQPQQRGPPCMFATRAFDPRFVGAIDECVLVVRLLGSLVLVSNVSTCSPDNNASYCWWWWWEYCSDIPLLLLDRAQLHRRYCISGWPISRTTSCAHARVIWNMHCMSTVFPCVLLLPLADSLLGVVELSSIEPFEH